MALTTNEIIESLAQELQKAIDDEIFEMIFSDTQPKLVFRRVKNDKYTLEYGMEYGPGSFTPTGLRAYHLTDIKSWCADNDCGEFIDMYNIDFRNEKEIFWFLLRWT